MRLVSVRMRQNCVKFSVIKIAAFSTWGGNNNNTPNRVRAFFDNPAVRRSVARSQIPEKCKMRETNQKARVGCSVAPVIIKNRGNPGLRLLRVSTLPSDKSRAASIYHGESAMFKKGARGHKKAYTPVAAMNKTK
jgi:hypothetical protein